MHIIKLFIESTKFSSIAPTSSVQVDISSFHPKSLLDKAEEEDNPKLSFLSDSLQDKKTKGIM